MDIYKLSDKILQKDDDERAVNSDKSVEYVLRITDIRQAVKNENRVNVFVNGKYSFSLDISQVVDLGVKKGISITPEQLAECKKASEFGKLYQRTLEWVLMRPRSERETRDYLMRKFKKSSSDALRSGPSLRAELALSLPVGREGSSENFFELSEKIVHRLVSKGYLDDEKFARYYVENRFVKKGVSNKRLKIELMKKGISRDIIDQVLEESDRNDEEEIKKIIAKKRGRYTDEKLIQYLCRQGFKYDLVKSAVEESINE